MTTDDSVSQIPTCGWWPQFSNRQNWIWKAAVLQIVSSKVTRCFFKTNSELEPSACFRTKWWEVY